MNHRVLILGGTGMLGHKLVQVFRDRVDTYYTIRGTYQELEKFSIFPAHGVVEEIDAMDFKTVRSAIEQARPTVVINAVGIIKQKPTSKNVTDVLTLNSILPNQLASLADEIGFRLITISTDCVFSGSKGMYTETDHPDACDLYGQSKRWGEVDSRACLTLRTSMIGRELKGHHSLVDWFLSQQGSVYGFANAIYSGFPTLVLAETILKIIQDHPELNGVLHVSSDPINKYELLRLINQETGSKVHIEKDTDFRIDRSLDSTRFRQATGFVPTPWPKMIARMISDSTPYDSWRT